MSFVLQRVKPSAGFDPGAGTYIVLFDALLSPPHLLLAHRGKIFSISATGRQTGSPLAKLIGFIERRQVPALFVEWLIPEKDQDDFENLVRNSYAAYPRLQPGKNSCLSPIRDAAAMIHGKDLQHCRFIFELLPALEKGGFTGNSYAFNLPAGNGESFTLTEYSENEIAETIRHAGRTLAGN